jgi:hypothetical protein
MTIPTKPLEVKVDLEELTLDELCLFSPGGFEVVAFRTFLRERTNWSREEIGALQYKELRQVGDQLAEAIQKIAVPLAS